MPLAKNLLKADPASFALQDASDLEDDDLSGLDSDTDGTQHISDLKALALKDPEFFKYLQENDAELLDFDGEAAEGSDDAEEDDEEDDEDSDVEMEDGGKKGKGKAKQVKVKTTPVLTKEILRGWQKSILEVRFPFLIRLDSLTNLSFTQTRSIRSLRKLLLAFRSAASSGGNEKEGERWEIQSAAG